MKALKKAASKAKDAFSGKRPTSMKCGGCDTTLGLPEGIWNWKCENGHTNDFKQGSCQDCQASRPEKLSAPSVRCPKRGIITQAPKSRRQKSMQAAGFSAPKSYYQEPKEFRCPQCHTKLQMPEGEWKCQKCKTMNGEKTLECEKCHQKQFNQQVRCGHCKVASKYSEMEVVLQEQKDKDKEKDQGIKDQDKDKDKEKDVLAKEEGAKKPEEKKAWFDHNGKAWIRCPHCTKPLEVARADKSKGKLKDKSIKDKSFKDKGKGKDKSEDQFDEEEDMFEEKECPSCHSMISYAPPPPPSASLDHKDSEGEAEESSSHPPTPTDEFGRPIPFATVLDEDKDKGKDKKGKDSSAKSATAQSSRDVREGASVASDASEASGASASGQASEQSGAAASDDVPTAEPFDGDEEGEEQHGEEGKLPQQQQQKQDQPSFDGGQQKNLPQRGGALDGDNQQSRQQQSDKDQLQKKQPQIDSSQGEIPRTRQDDALPQGGKHEIDDSSSQPQGDGHQMKSNFDEGGQSGQGGQKKIPEISRVEDSSDRDGLAGLSESRPSGGISGDKSGISGDKSGISGISGDKSGISGDNRGISGDKSGISQKSGISGGSSKRQRKQPHISAGDWN